MNYGECAARARTLAASDALSSGGGGLVRNMGNLEAYLFLRQVQGP